MTTLTLTTMTTEHVFFCALQRTYQNNLEQLSTNQNTLEQPSLKSIVISRIGYTFATANKLVAVLIDMLIQKFLNTKGMVNIKFTQHFL